MKKGLDFYKETFGSDPSEKVLYYYKNNLLYFYHTRGFFYGEYRENLKKHFQSTSFLKKYIEERLKVMEEIIL